MEMDISESEKVKGAVHKPSRYLGEKTMAEPKNRKKIFVATICKYCTSSMIIYVDSAELEGIIGNDVDVPIQCGICKERYTVSLDRTGGVRSY